MTELTHVWQQARGAALIRDGRECVVCNEVTNLHVHHRIPRHLGGTDEPSNLTTLCGACHAAHHPTLQVSLSRRWIISWAVRLARWLDKHGEIPDNVEGFTDVLRMLGKERFRDGQLEIVLAALRGESLLGIRPTGSGKTLCFQVPTLLRPGTAYVLSPLKALMADQVSELQQLRIPGTFINSDVIREEKQGRYDLLANAALKFLYVTPERFDSTVVRDPKEIAQLTRTAPSYLIVDEAHCVDRWGNDFRPSYGRLEQVRQELGNPPVLAFTATAGKEAQKRIVASIGIPDARVFVTGVNRPNISLIRHEPINDAERFKITLRLVQRTTGKTMIFVPTLKIGEKVKKGLLGVGLAVPFFHGQLPGHERDMLLDQFKEGIHPEANTIICTNAFGMGLDIGNVRTVIHWVQPESVEDYLQEFGRAGRDGKPAVAVIFKQKGDIGVREFMARQVHNGNANPTNRAQAIARRIEAIHELDNMIRDKRKCFRRSIVIYFEDIKPQKRSLAMRILEWLFSTRVRVEQGPFCCDACAPKRAFKLMT